MDERKRFERLDIASRLRSPSRHLPSLHGQHMHRLRICRNAAHGGAEQRLGGLGGLADERSDPEAGWMDGPTEHVPRHLAIRADHRPTELASGAQRPTLEDLRAVYPVYLSI